MGICQRDKNQIKEQKTAQDHQWVFNNTRKSGKWSEPLNKNLFKFVTHQIRIYPFHLAFGNLNSWQENDN